ncbi:HNH endonuclease signature motif containing protein [Petropleomorpha daqingensis]|uniref:HNH nuclease domain-containing protein n=1 Tax=Petropleomorpha daqingensis TaxID=2026353 RepID=A0A853CFP5_9ACTN|nr:HNH endonuclease signature motif containing protein [Petropleomorpha daqingensis]NYJ05991.1 hypothetical protein [Petropleomorpha daqingensis]
MGSKNDTEHPSGSPLPELAWAITAGAVRLAAATAAWLRLVAEFDERDGWSGVGIRSCGAWLAWQCGLAPGTAREHVRVARALRGLPRIEAAFAGGRLSYAKVRALTRIAAPDCEAALLEFALSATASQTERFCREWRRIDDEDAAGGAERRTEVGQSFEFWIDESAGCLTLKVRMPLEAGTELMCAIDALAEREARRERAQNTKAAAAHAEVRAAGGRVDRALLERCAEDAAVGLARERTAARRIAALGTLATARVELDRRPGDPPRREVVVHVDATVLADDTAAGRAHYEGGPAITGAQARRILCDATVVAMLESGREPLAVGRRKRRATKAQRRALLRRDGGCARPGCPESRIERLHAHHMRHWLAGGRTDLDNLVLLCDTDHGLVHDHDLVLSRTSGRLVALDADGRHVWGSADAAFATGLAGLAADRTTDTDAFVGVTPIDTAVGRRPTDLTAAVSDVAAAGTTHALRRRRTSPPRRSPARPAHASHRPASRRPGRRTALGRPAEASVERRSARVSRVLYPEGEPALADSLQERYDRMDLRYAVGVLMGNRDLTRRLAAEGRRPYGT